jgi:precorrin-4/cobalt-precorrin-4 C11-methyltransferase
MTLEEMTAWLIEGADQHATVVRLQTGDPGLYGALIEMTQPLTPPASTGRRAGRHLGDGLGGRRGRDADPAGSHADGDPDPRRRAHAHAAGRGSRGSLARIRRRSASYLSITLLHKVQEALRAAGWAEDAPMLVVHKASWPGEEKIIRGTLADIKQKCQAAKIASQAMIIASPTLGAPTGPTWPARNSTTQPSRTASARRTGDES